MAWAIEQQEITEPGSRFVLICLANYSDAIGKNAFPSIPRLSKDSGLSESSVRRRLHSLEKAGLIRQGNQNIAAAYIGRADRRPIVYDLVIERPVTQQPRIDNGVSPRPERGVREKLTTCQADTQSVRDPSFNQEQDAFKKAKEEAEKIGFRSPEAGESAESYRMAVLRYSMRH